MSKKKNKKALKAKAKQQRIKKAERRFRVQQWLSWTIVAVLALISIVLSLFWVPGELHYVITEIYTFTSAESAKINLAVLLPASGPTQEISTPEITWPGIWHTETDGDQTIIRFEADLDAEQEIEAVIKYQVKLFQGEAFWSGEPILDDDLVSSETIQSDDPALINKAGQLILSGDMHRTVSQIFDFTQQTLRFEDGTASDVDVSALHAFQTGTGGSQAHANLMAALSRAADVPAHVVSGLVIPELVPFIPLSAGGEHPEAARSWVEVYADDRWQVADPSLSKAFYQRGLFGWMDGKHLTYGTTSQIENVREALAGELGGSARVVGEGEAPVYFIAWSDASVEMGTTKPTVTILKTWDARYLMSFSIIIILVVINWLLEKDRRRTRDRRITSK